MSQEITDSLGYPVPEPTRAQRIRSLLRDMDKLRRYFLAGCEGRLPWSDVYINVFNMNIWQQARDLGLPHDWYDPDGSCEEDVKAYSEGMCKHEENWKEVLLLEELNNENRGHNYPPPPLCFMCNIPKVRELHRDWHCPRCND